MSSRYPHPYNRELYDQMADWVVDQPFPTDDHVNTIAKAEIFRGIDLFHLHWPELILNADPASHIKLIQTLQQLKIGIVWTQHNLLPHNCDPIWAEIYQLWATAADAVIHHSRWGLQRVLDYRPYAPGAIHAVIPHGHWQNLIENTEVDTGAEPGADWIGKRSRLQLGILGAPRGSKDVLGVVRAFLACERDDLELVIYSLGPDEVVPPHPRIHSVRYRRGPRSVYNRRLSTIDVLVLPFGNGGNMLTTGLVGDVVGKGIPALISEWDYLQETLGEAGIPFGGDGPDLTTCLRQLTREELDRAASASRALRDVHAWSTIAEQTLELLEAVSARKAGV